MTSRLATLACVLLLLGGACAGPEPPLEAGVKEFPTDVLYGSTGEVRDTGGRATPPPPREPGGPLVLRPSRRATPPPTRPPVTQPEPDPCPEAHPLDFPEHEATRSVSVAPVEATYRYRSEGTFELTGPEDQSGTFPPFVREIDVLSEGPGAFEFEAVDEGLGVVTRYRVVSDTQQSPQDAGRGEGLFITEIRSETAEGVDTFRPVDPMKVVEFPISEGDDFEAVGTSPTGSTVMSYHAQVGRTVGEDDDGFPIIEEKARVDACGTPLQGWWIELTDGQITGPGKDLSFTAQLALGTQFGGFPLLETWEISGSDAGHGVSSNRTSTISVEPRFPS